LNNNKFFSVDTGLEVRAMETGVASASSIRLIPAEDEDTYYLQSVDEPDKYVCW